MKAYAHEASWPGTPTTPGTPDEPPEPRFAIDADVVSDGRYLGQITEAVVELRA